MTLDVTVPKYYADQNVIIGGKRYEAFCQSGFIETGAPLQVIGADNFRLIVSPSQPDTQP